MNLLFTIIWNCDSKKTHSKPLKVEIIQTRARNVYKTLVAYSLEFR